MSGPPRFPTVGVVVLAAGASRRMGQPKMLLPWRQTTVLGHILQRWRSLHPAQIAVVHDPRDQAVQRGLDRCALSPADRIPNPTPDDGMFSSILTAARWPGWKPGVDRWVIALGDQPLIRPHSLHTLLHFAAQHPLAICQLSLRGAPKHPVLLPAGLWSQLATTEHSTLKDFLGAHAALRRLCPADDPGLALDLDHPQDYAEAIALDACGHPPKGPAGQA